MSRLGFRHFSSFGCRLRAAGGKGSFAASAIFRQSRPPDLKSVIRALASFALRGRRRGPTQCGKRKE
ncbi:hypothetical protein FHP24_26815 [Aliirhizobium smilacinae]|uniref:Uncharacterized protein n=1 Tax=Aliirhizobium smilacinae TaxID=1395944 RepID=A0A5C4X9U1_9HYPH|nr:hypothetical protein FHP24_26815 [Rhizobium smilacinae]